MFLIYGIILFKIHYYFGIYWNYWQIGVAFTNWVSKNIPETYISAFLKLQNVNLHRLGEGSNGRVGFIQSCIGIIT